MKKFLLVLFFLIQGLFAQTYITIPDKETGNTLSAAEFNTILDAIKDGTLSIKTAGILVGGAHYTVFMLPSAVRDSVVQIITDSSYATIDSTEMEDGDYGDFSVSSNVASLDANVVTTSEIDATIDPTWSGKHTHLDTTFHFGRIVLRGDDAGIDSIGTAYFDSLIIGNGTPITYIEQRTTGVDSLWFHTSATDSFGVPIKE